jgi:hypothetical protein
MQRTKSSKRKGSSSRSGGSKGSHAGGFEHEAEAEEDKAYWFEAQKLEDHQGLITNAGMIAALMLSLSVAAFASINSQAWQSAAFRRCMFISPEYRRLLVGVLEMEDPAFNFTLAVGSRIYDAKHAMLNKHAACSAHDMHQDYAVLFCGSEYGHDMATAARFVEAAVPWGKLAAVLSFEETARLRSGCDYSEGVHLRGMLANVFLGLGVLGPLLLYTSLNAAHAAASKHDLVLTTWGKRGGSHAIMACYVCLFIGTACFFSGLVEVVEVQSASPYFVRRSAILVFLAGMIPLFAVFLFAAVHSFLKAKTHAATHHSARSKSKSKNKNTNNGTTDRTNIPTPTSTPQEQPLASGQLGAAFQRSASAVEPV